MPYQPRRENDSFKNTLIPVWPQRKNHTLMPCIRYIFCLDQRPDKRGFSEHSIINVHFFPHAPAAAALKYDRIWLFIKETYVYTQHIGGGSFFAFNQ